MILRMHVEIVDECVRCAWWLVAWVCDVCVLEEHGVIDNEWSPESDSRRERSKIIETYIIFIPNHNKLG